MTVTIYGRTYLDAEVTIPLATLAEGKGKVDVEVTAQLGGFACNAARAIGNRLLEGSVRVVTVCSELDLPRLRVRIPSVMALDAIVDTTDPTAWPPISVIINPAGECRLLRGRGEEDAAQWTLDRVAPDALASGFHILGRVPLPFVGELLASRPSSARIAWCGGDSISEELEREMDIACVNVAEAQRLLGTSTTNSRVLAHALVRRAARSGAVRLVTGRGSEPAVAARLIGDSVTSYGASSPPAKLPPSEIRRFKGVGDVFAARFLFEAFVDPKGEPRAEVAIERALTMAGEAATAFITAREPP